MKKNQVFQHIIEVCERASRGDLEARLTPSPKDGEVAQVYAAINNLLDLSDSYVRESAAAMDHCAQGHYHRPIIRRGMRGSYQNASKVVNEAILRMRQHAETIERMDQERKRLALEVAEASNQAATNVGAVAAACHELSVCTTEITKQTHDSNKLTRSAVTEADQAQHAVAELGKAAGQINLVVDVITKIAHQTNLLALNATIEAARAGEHGRSFAVVATEVKNLSRETASATDKISQQIDALQKAMANVAHIIEGVTDSIRRIDTNANSITGSITEQAKATEEISARINEVSRVTTDLSAKTAAAANSGNGHGHG